MPDNDFVPGRIPRQFRQAFGLIAGGAPSAFVADELRTAVPAALRASNGCVGARELGLAVRDAAIYGSEDGWRVAVERFLAANEHSPIAMSVWREAEALLGADAEGLQGANDDAVCQGLVEAGLRRLIQEQMLGRGRDRLLERFGDYNSERAFEEQAMDQTPIAEIAAELLRKPDAKGLRAPKSAILRESMEALMSIDLEAEEF